MRIRHRYSPVGSQRIKIKEKNTTVEPMSCFSTKYCDWVVCWSTKLNIKCRLFLDQRSHFGMNEGGSKWTILLEKQLQFFPFFDLKEEIWFNDDFFLVQRRQICMFHDDSPCCPQLWPEIKFKQIKQLEVKGQYHENCIKWCVAEPKSFNLSSGSTSAPDLLVFCYF